MKPKHVFERITCTYFANKNKPCDARIKFGIFRVCFFTVEFMDGWQPFTIYLNEDSKKIVQMNYDGRPVHISNRNAKQVSSPECQLSCQKLSTSLSRDFTY